MEKIARNHTAPMLTMKVNWDLPMIAIKLIFVYNTLRESVKVEPIVDMLMERKNWEKDLKIKKPKGNRWDNKLCLQCLCIRCLMHPIWCLLHTCQCPIPIITISNRDFHQFLRCLSFRCRINLSLWRKSRILVFWKTILNPKPIFCNPIIHQTNQ